MLDERDIFDINRSVGASEKMFSINFSKAKTTFCLSLDYNHDNTWWLYATKVLDKITWIIGIFNFDDTKILIEADHKLSDDITFKNVVIFTTA